MIVSPDSRVRARDLPGEVSAAAAPARASQTGSEREFRDVKREVVEEFERSYLDRLMGRHGGNVTAAAQQAGMLRSALQRLLRKYGLKSADFRRQRASVKSANVPRPGS